MIHIVFVYTNGSDCTNGGISSKKDMLWLSDDPYNIEGADLILRVKIFEGGIYKYCEPVEPKKEGNIGWMSGGNFVYSCDSRFRERVSTHPIPVHDRQETYEEYEALSI